MSDIVLSHPGDLGLWNVIGERFVPLATGGDFELFDVTAAEGSGPPPHRHPWAEAYFIIEGELQVESGGERFVLGAGSAAQIPGGTVHSYRVTSRSARFLTITSPSGAGTFFADMNENVREMPVDAPKIPAVAARNRVEVMAPAPV